MEAEFRKIEADMFVSPQIGASDVAAAKEAGFTLIINNRPDGEEPSAPQGAEIEAAVNAAGIDYIAIPITRAGFSRPQIDTMNASRQNGRQDARILPLRHALDTAMGIGRGSAGQFPPHNRRQSRRCRL